MKQTPEISIIIVNYNSSEYVKRCLESIQHDSCETIIVDNASSPTDVKELRTLSDENIHVYFNQENRGFAGGCNQGLQYSKGRYLFFLNPDTILLENALDKLVNFFASSKDVGAVGPRIWWDIEKTVQLPRSGLPSLYLDLKFSLSQTSLFSQSIHKSNAIRDYHYWSTGKPSPVEMLSGAAIFTSREVITNVGVFDENLSLYFEDSDWCRRVSQKGYGLVMLPDSEICHLYNQSAKKVSSQAREKFEKSEKYYRQKHYHPLFIKLSHRISSMLKRASASKLPVTPINLKTEETSPDFVLNDKDKGEVLFQFSLNPSFSPAAGMVFNKPQYKMSDMITKHLAKGVYYTRFLDTESWSVLGMWRYEKG